MAPPGHRVVVTAAIGLGQILTWGASYYLLSVLAGPIEAATGWSATWIIGGLSLGLLVSGLVSPRVGHLIDRHGGRPVSQRVRCCCPSACCSWHSLRRCRCSSSAGW